MFLPKKNAASNTFRKIYIFKDIYRQSINIGHTVYFTKHTGHLKMLFLQFFYICECSFVCLLCSEREKIEKNAFLNVLCVL